MYVRSKLNTVCNDLKTFWSIFRSDGRLRSWQRLPTTLEITSTCNLHCPLCPTGTGNLKRANKFMSMDTFDRIVEVTSPIANGYILSMWGEPVLHPEFSLMVEKIHPHLTWVATNLNYKESIAEEMAKWDHLHLICAVDTLDAAAYTDYRVGGKYGVMLRNLDILAKGKCNVYPQFLVEEGDDRNRYAEFAKEHGIPQENVIIKIKRENFMLHETDEPAPGNCHAPYAGIYFNCDGYMIPCCNDVQKDLHMGHINYLDLDAILNRGDVASFRKRLGEDKNQFPSCGQCNGEPFSKTRLVVYKDFIKQILPRLAGQAKGPQKMPFREPDFKKNSDGK